MAVHYVSDYEEVTGKQRDAEPVVVAKVVEAASDTPVFDATAVAETKAV